MIFIIGVVPQGLSDSSKRAYELAHELASEGEMATEFLQAFFNQIETASAQGEFQDDMSPLLVPHNSREQVTRTLQLVLHLENDAVCSNQMGVFHLSWGLVELVETNANFDRLNRRFQLI